LDAALRIASRDIYRCEPAADKMKTVSQQWNADLYQQSHSFVWELGNDLVGMLAPQAGECILDVGCGTGQLTARIARSGARVLGIDASPAMVEQAQNNFPELRFEVCDVRAMTYDGAFDAVFSNAALHWVQPAAAVAAIARALKPGGRLMVELGGHGNIAEIIRAAEYAWQSLGAGPLPAHPWFFPDIAEYTALLVRCGLETTLAVLFDRPTPFDGGAEGLARWIGMFGGHWMAALPPERHAEFLDAVAREAAPRLWRDGAWVGDYRRLRVVARKLTT
jgi:trans-aconitate methyltransferase